MYEVNLENKQGSVLCPLPHCMQRAPSRRTHTPDSLTAPRDRPSLRHAVLERREVNLQPAHTPRASPGRPRFSLTLQSVPPLEGTVWGCQCTWKEEIPQNEGAHKCTYGFSDPSLAPKLYKEQKAELWLPKPERLRIKPMCSWRVITARTGVTCSKTKVTSEVHLPHKSLKPRLCTGLK